MKHFFCAIILLGSTIGLFAQTQVPYTIAQRYFLKNGAQQMFEVKGTTVHYKDFIFIGSKAELEATFGYATVMGPNGTPTKIDFTKQFAIALFVTAEETIQNLNVISLTKVNKDLVLTYAIEKGTKAEGTSKAFKILIIDKKYGGPIKTIQKTKKVDISPNTPSSNSIPYHLAKHYFAKNDGSGATIITSKENFDASFGAAAVMGHDGVPTPIDFNQQFVIALQVTNSTNATTITVKSITQKGTEGTVNYDVQYGEKLTYTASHFLIVVIDKKYTSNFNFKRTIATATFKLKIEPIENDGALGQVTFSSSEKTLFYYNIATKKGLINLNGTSYELTNYKFFNHNGTKKKYDGYTLSGNGVSITAPDVRPKPSDGGDCFYGTIPVVTITLNGSSTIVKNISVQDCPNY